MYRLLADRVEMRPPFPVHAAPADEAHVGLKEEGGGLEGVMGAFGSRVTPGKLTEFVVDGG